MVKEGVFVVLYGPSKSGKTTAAAMLGWNGEFFASPGALHPLRSHLGLKEISVTSVQSIEEATKRIKGISSLPPCVVIDDFSLMVESMVGEVEADRRFQGWKLWEEVNRRVRNLRNLMRMLTSEGTHVVFTCHEKPQRDTAGGIVRGGPSLPGQLPERFTAMADVVGRVVYNTDSPVWPYQMVTHPQAKYITGDRLSVFPSPGPLNLAESLRASGYEVPWPEEWMGEVAEEMCKILSSSAPEDFTKIWKAVVKKHEKKDHRLLRWALQDGSHRRIIDVSMKNKIMRANPASNAGW